MQIYNGDVYAKGNNRGKRKLKPPKEILPIPISTSQTKAGRPEKRAGRLFILPKKAGRQEKTAGRQRPPKLLSREHYVCMMCHLVTYHVYN